MSENYFKCLLIPTEFDVIPMLVVRCYKYMGSKAAISFIEMFLNTNKHIMLSPEFVKDGIYDILINHLDVDDYRGDLSQFKSNTQKVKDMTRMTYPISVTIFETINETLA